MWERISTIFVLAGAHLGTVRPDLGDDARSGTAALETSCIMSARRWDKPRSCRRRVTPSPTQPPGSSFGHARRGDGLYFSFGGVILPWSSLRRWGRLRRASAGDHVLETSRQEISGALGGAIAAHSQDVGLGTQLGVGGQQRSDRSSGVVAAGWPSSTWTMTLMVRLRGRSR